MTSNYFINNNNRIDSLKLKEGAEINADDKFLKKYDSNGNSIWDADEIHQFMEDLCNADLNNDGKIDKEESISWFANVTNTTIEKTKSLFATETNNAVYNSLGNIIRETAEEYAVNRINQNSKEGFEIYNIAIGGDISKTWNSLKELFNTEYAGDRVYRQLVNQQVSALLLDKTKNKDGLTKKEYIETKIQLLKYFLGEDKLSAQEQQILNEGILDINEKTLDSLISSLVNAEDDEYPNLQQKIINQFKNNMSDSQKDVGFKKIHKGVNSLAATLESSGTEKLTFDEVFKIEMGVPFNQNNSIEKYEKQLLQTTSVVSAYNKVSKIVSDLEDKISAMEGYNQHGNTTGLNGERDILYKNLSTSILNALHQYYGQDENKINEVLAEYGAKLENDTITFGAKGVDDYAIVTLAKSLSEKLQSNLKTFMGDKSLEEYENDLKQAYQNAYGTKNSVELAKKFQESQQDGIGYAKIGVSTAGIALAVLSDGTLLPLTGVLLGAFGSGGISALEAVTKEGGMSKEDAKEIANELVTSGVLTLTGIKEGQIATQIGYKLLSSCPKFMKYLGEYGSMAVMGALTDYAVMGEISLSQETISNIINVATGVIAHKRMSKVLANRTETSVAKTSVESENSLQSVMNKIKTCDDIVATKSEILFSQEFQSLSAENQKAIIKTIDGISEIVTKTGKNTAEAIALLEVRVVRNCSIEDITVLSKTLDKYPELKTDLLEIINSNYNVKFGMDINGNVANHIETIAEAITSNPQYKDKIIDYIKVQRRADNDTSNPTKSIEAYIETLKKYPDQEEFIVELSKNGNLDAKSTDGGINTIEVALNLNLKQGFSKEDILILSRQNYSVPAMRKCLYTIKKHPELRNIILNEQPQYKLIDSNPAVTPETIIEQRNSIKNNLEQNYSKEMEKLRQTLGGDFYSNVRWEDIIPKNATSNEIKSILNTLNENSKFFARTSVNESKYGKNIQWASKMNDISNGAECLIRQGEPFDNVLSYISSEYHVYDEASTLASNHAERSDRRLASGNYRGNDIPDGYYGTPFNKNGDYQEYFDRLTNVKNRKAPYDDIELTNIQYSKELDRGMMRHPENKYVNAGIDHIREKYEELQPLFEKVKSGQSLSKNDIKVANDKIAEIYFLMANVMPYERGSNGVSDILMRSIYKSLNIEQPALKRGVSLDLEAFCMDLDEYKNKWNTFFENN